MKRRLKDFMGFRTDDHTRAAITQLAEIEERSLGDMARTLLNEALKAREASNK